MIRIGKTYSFEAAHYLPHVPDGHKCKNMHGHNYRVEFELEASRGLDECGFVIDFFELDEIVQPLLNQCDHRVLNDVPGLENPTAENIAHWFLMALPQVSRVRVYEREDCWAEITRSA